MTMRLDERVQRGHYYAIVDEVDNILIDEARTPLIISGPAQDESEFYLRTAQVVRALRPEDFELNDRDRTITLTELGEMHVEELLGTPLSDPDRPEDVTPEQARMRGFLEQALRAQYLFKRNKDYLVQAGKVVIVDEFTGRLMPGRRWSDGLHQAVEAKEGVRVQAENVTYATITIQNYFRMYDKLCGMTGTALTEAEEFDKIYKLDVIAIPTNLEYQAIRDGSSLVQLEERDEQGYKFKYYSLRDDLEKIARRARRRGIASSITTNGQLLDARRAASLKRAGFDTVQISVDGSTPERNARMRATDVAAFERIVEGVRICRRLGLDGLDGIAETDENHAGFPGLGLGLAIDDDRVVGQGLDRPRLPQRMSGVDIAEVAHHLAAEAPDHDPEAVEMAMAVGPFTVIEKGHFGVGGA
jgi:hypothetical protein